ncbi:MAG: hypothetical protein COZ06_31555 [Armatimonadetes bacterium CG_4_10_14_3_um_filter_66_18]|nr:hypothetical protein [Armatimonadota bacterium]OIO99002.1 MAG: hypothetical protein AUJ96_20200 [Armatimonadetes bacterium CG2_30_66_41]PIU91818.1 MAG: hypothetical protein COS65_20770 [Armatimonadetes bacterium CG06_land_8_20_14_3_00_66_21]PIW19853.1 MAG: hypothetical protein COW34_03245 [Armatimonadetes bacterium CG17_big_fil_post_rev_8_21_14_2_50_66_6]PIX37318.1 MAG: hypothetical protein COZ57_34980 [Armatimonadetes bacterium CG_4_8_14_3_um_filter_66_20]PIY38211.1 MAG: hypothetical prote
MAEPTHALRFTPRAERDTARLRGLRGRAWQAICVLKPREDQPDQTESFCLVFMVGPLENFYREAERRLKALRRSGEI